MNNPDTKTSAFGENLVETNSEYETKSPTITKAMIIKIALVVILCLSLIVGFIWWKIKSFGGEDVDKGALSVAKPIETIGQEDFGIAPTVKPPPPGMNTTAVDPNAAQNTIDQATLEREAREKELLENRYKSNLIVTDNGNSMAVGAEDPTAKKELSPELAAIFGAMGVSGNPNSPNGSGAGSSGSVTNVNSQGGRFQSGTSIAPSSYASHIDSREYMVLQGKVIPAVIVNGINSDLPGMLIAQVTEPVYGEQGRYQLLPAGTRVFGEYSSDVKYGQAAIAAIWRRAVTPQGIQIMLDSPSTNGLGLAGIHGGKVNNHFIQTFGTAALLSIIGASSSTLGVNSRDRGNSLSQYRSELQNSFQDTASSILEQRRNIPPTIKVREGQKINILVAKDLNFTSLFSN